VLLCACDLDDWRSASFNAQIPVGVGAGGEW
jgi:hypothetical protein